MLFKCYSLYLRLFEKLTDGLGIEIVKAFQLHIGRDVHSRHIVFKQNGELSIVIRLGVILVNPKIPKLPIKPQCQGETGSVAEREDDINLDRWDKAGDENEAKGGNSDAFGLRGKMDGLLEAENEPSQREADEHERKLNSLAK